PVRDLVVDRAARVTERNPAIHAARGLVARSGVAERDVELAVVAQTLLDRPVLPVAPVDLEEPRNLAHQFVSFSVFYPPSPGGGGSERSSAPGWGGPLRWS